MSLRSLLSAEVLIAAPLFMCAPLAATGDSDVERGKDVGAEGGASMYRFPDISNDEIVFVYANDLWRVSDEGAWRFRSRLLPESRRFRGFHLMVRRSLSSATTTATVTCTWSRPGVACLVASRTTRPVND